MVDILLGRTSITIAHRLSTIVGSDFICFIRDGKVAEKGSHAELIDPDYLREKGHPGLYYGLAAKQFNLPPLPF
jgi:ABC-type transport system involved in Fe-S cluster assembly fused permease/ATPase subunit